jgi:hypothetical protein
LGAQSVHCANSRSSLKVCSGRVVLDHGVRADGMPIRAAVGVAMADLVDGELAPIDPRTLAGEQPALPLRCLHWRLAGRAGGRGGPLRRHRQASQFVLCAFGRCQLLDEGR